VLFLLCTRPALYLVFDNCINDTEFECDISVRMDPNNWRELCAPGPSRLARSVSFNSVINSLAKRPPIPKIGGGSVLLEFECYISVRIPKIGGGFLRAPGPSSPFFLTIGELQFCHKKFCETKVLFQAFDVFQSRRPPIPKIGGSYTCSWPLANCNLSFLIRLKLHFLFS